ncbi:hypothetical protein [Pseudoalteromonas sp. ASV78]|uniref:hypothetical protein n=1 Tax=Pseudoalteromonas sp. ASV78 TaxID=3397851 RepID=UPI0039FD96FD
MTDIAIYESMTNDKLITELAECLTVSAKQLVKAAQIFNVLELRGVDLSYLKTGLGAFLPAIANNVLDAEVVIRYAGRKDILNHLSKVGIDVQRKLLENDTVELVIDDNGQPRTETTSLANVRTFNLSKIFDFGRIKTVSEQLESYKQLHRKAPPKKRKNRKPTAVRSFSVDREHGGIRVGLLFAEPESLIDILCQFYGSVENLEKQLKNSQI